LLLIKERGIIKKEKWYMQIHQDKTVILRLNRSFT